MPEVRYKNNGSNQFLRHILCRAWDQQCHSCREYKGYLDLQIDHILPKDAGESELLRLKEMFGLRNDYDVHALYNLAPICGPCNQMKSNHDFTETLLVKLTLTKASKLSPGVARQVMAFGKSSKLGGALLEATGADLSDAETRNTFEQLAPAVVQRLAELGEGKADFFAFRIEEVEVGDELWKIGFRLNERGRGAVTVLEKVVGGRLSGALSAPLSDLVRRVSSDVADAFENNERMGVPDVDAFSIDWSRVAIDRIEFESTPPAQLEFEFTGKFDATGSTMIARDSPLNGELEYVQGDAAVACRFTFVLSWAPDDPIGVFEFDETLIEDWEVDLSVEGGSYRLWEDDLSGTDHREGNGPT